MRDMVPASGDTPRRAAASRGAREYVRWEEQLPGTLTRLGLDTNGVVQVGAHTGQEIEALTKCGFRRLVLIEPNREFLSELSRQLDVHRDAGLPLPDQGYSPREMYLAAAGHVEGKAMLYVTEYDQQSSVLQPLQPMAVTHAQRTPVLPVRDVQHGCNVLVVDVQGAEIDVLRGADLDRLDLAVIESSTIARYRGGATAAGIAEFMMDSGWQYLTQWTHARPHVADEVWVSPAVSIGVAEAA